LTGVPTIASEMHSTITMKRTENFEFIRRSLSRKEYEG